MRIVRITDEYHGLLQDFIDNLGISSDSFRYFRTRQLAVLQNHIVTLGLLNSSGEIIGYGHLDQEDGTVWLGIALLPGHTSKGLGSLLMDHLLKAASELSLKKIMLSVDETNVGAIRLYKKYGFTESHKKDKTMFFYKGEAI